MRGFNERIETLILLLCYLLQLSLVLRFFALLLLDGIDNNFAQINLTVLAKLLID